MPEGHTLHRVARDHTKLFTAQKLVVSSPQGRFAEEARRLTGRQVERIDAHGKHLFYHWKPKGRSKKGDVLHIHLGLYGKFRVHKTRDESGDWPEPRGAVRLRVEAEDAAFDLNGPNRCELTDAAGYQGHVERLGPDPLRRNADPERAWDRISRSKTGVGALLMNQEVIAGVGNIYRCEVLHLLHIHPERPGQDLERDEFDAIWAKLVELMKLGVKHNKIIITDPADAGKPAGRMTREERLRVYKKKACLQCGGEIEAWKIAGRQVYACPGCQD